MRLSQIAQDRVALPQGEASSCRVGTRPVGFMARYSGVSVLPNAPPTSMRSKGKPSSPSPHRTFITLLDVARPQTILLLMASPCSRYAPNPGLPEPASN